MNTLKRPVVLAVLGAAVMLSSGGLAAADEDHEAGVSLSPTEAAGSWTLESGGRSICTVKLGTEKVGGGAFKAQAAADCADALPGGVAGWAPSPHGMNLIGADGQTLIGFGRWSNSLLVSHRSSGVDVQLRRGT